jgi:hypothetical protein
MRLTKLEPFNYPIRSIEYLQHHQTFPLLKHRVGWEDDALLRTEKFTIPKRLVQRTAIVNAAHVHSRLEDRALVGSPDVSLEQNRNFLKHIVKSSISRPAAI